MSIKPVKYLCALLLALTIVTVGLACGGTGASVSAQDVLENALAAQEDVNSFRLDATITADVQSSGTQTTITADANYALDLEDREMEGIADVNMQMPGFSLAAEVQAYVVDNYTYVMTSALGQTEWAKQALPVETWQSIENGRYQIESLLDSVEAETVKEESLNGVDCYVLELTPDLSELQQALMEQPGIGDALADMPDLESIVQNMDIRVWVAKDTYFIMKADIDMTLVMDPEAMGVPASEGTATVELSLQMTVSDYNEPVSVDLPPEALSASEGTSGLDLPFF